MRSVFSQGDAPPAPPEKAGYRLEFQDEFDGPNLDAGRWFPFYLPQWSSRERSRPNFAFEDGCLVLRIAGDQQPWCPEFDGAVKCSSIQTGVYAGPLGSPIGQHRFNPACRVREAQENRALYAPRYGYFEMRARAAPGRANHVAVWMIGFEDAPERSGEIDIFEIMGAHMRGGESRIGHGVRRWADPKLRDDFREPFLAVDASNFHIYALEWLPDRLDFYVDHVRISTIDQSPDYPMQFMLSIYELPVADGSGGAGEPYPPDPQMKEFAIDYFRAYQPVGGY